MKSVRPRAGSRPLVDAVVEVAHVRCRAILLIAFSFFTLGVVPLSIAGTAHGAARGADESAPASVVHHLHRTLLTVLQRAEELGYQGRFDRLAPALDEAFDLEYMAEKAVGRHWKKLGEEDKKRWRFTFAELTRANYAARFDRYSGQTFEVAGEEPGASETIVVRTKVVDPADEDVDLNYRLHETDAGWKIIDVYLKGTVSELAMRRADYASVLKRDGFEALVTTLRRKIAALAAGPVRQ